MCKLLESYISMRDWFCGSRSHLGGVFAFLQPLMSLRLVEDPNGTPAGDHETAPGVLDLRRRTLAMEYLQWQLRPFEAGVEAPVEEPPRGATAERERAESEEILERIERFSAKSDKESSAEYQFEERSETTEEAREDVSTVKEKESEEVDQDEAAGSTAASSSGLGRPKVQFEISRPKPKFPASPVTKPKVQAAWPKVFGRNVF